MVLEKHIFSALWVCLICAAPTFVLKLCHLGVIFDSTLTFDKRMNAVVKSSFFQLWLLAKVKPFLFQRLWKGYSSLLNWTATAVVIQMSVCYWLGDSSWSAALLLSGTHISPILASLHWLPISFLNNFKIWLFVFKSFHWLMPVCFTNLLTLHTPTRGLRSSEQMHLAVLRSRLKYRGGWVFQQMSLNCGTNCLCVSRLLQH